MSDEELLLFLDTSPIPPVAPAVVLHGPASASNQEDMGKARIAVGDAERITSKPSMSGEVSALKIIVKPVSKLTKH